MDSMAPEPTAPTVEVQEDEIISKERYKDFLNKMRKELSSLLDMLEA